MKVYESHGSIFQRTNKGVNKQGTSDSDFKKIMDQVTSQPGKTEGVTKSENLVAVTDGVRILRGADQVKGELDSPAKEHVIAELKETLDIVDHYATRLADASLSVRGITPLISHLEERLEGLRKMEAASGIPEKIKPIISDMAITIGTEIAKFKRGDYS